MPFGSIVSSATNLRMMWSFADVDVGVGRSSAPFRVRPWLRRVRPAAAGRRLPAASCRRGFGQLGDRVERPRDVEVAADLGRLGAADVGAAFVVQVFDEVAERRARRRLPGRRWFRCGRFRRRLPAALVRARLDEAEGGRVDFVVVAFVADVGLVGEQRQAAFEVDVFAADACRSLRPSCRVRGARLGAVALERAGEADVHVAAFVAADVDVSFRSRSPLSIPSKVASSSTVFGFVGASAAAAAAGGEDGGQPASAAKRRKIRSRLKAVESSWRVGNRGVR